LSSGNDAAVALAYALAGSVEAFVDKMNDEASNLGLTNTIFTDPAGIEASNLTTARDYAKFCRYYLNRHPQATLQLHKVKQFTYPQYENWGRASNNWPPYTFYNRNTILNLYPYADGLKTGYIDESGYNLAASANKEGRRLIAIVLGVPAPGSTTGALRRAEEAINLFEYGFSRYELIQISKLSNFPTLRARLWGGKQPYLSLTIKPSDDFMTIKTGDSNNIVFESIKLDVLASSNLKVGQNIGKVSLLNYNNSSYTAQLTTTQSLARRSPLGFLNEATLWAVKKIFS
jgi:D-alanyl-D-alanine carboxypeptidase (penicillin-binding protein 5/6)